MFGFLFFTFQIQRFHDAAFPSCVHHSFLQHASLALAGEWVSLSDSDSLEGWKKVGGGATYVLKDGVITGTTGEGKNTFLTSWSLQRF